MATIGTRWTSPSRLRLLGIVRWVLPLGLFAIAVLFEWNEHARPGSEPVTPGFYGEVLLFGVVGPIAVAVTLGWVARLVATLQTTSSSLAESNRDLEERIADRTRNLQAAGEQLTTANTELARANQDLRQLDHLKSEFVSLVSHQLRAPLTNINGALEIVAQDASGLPARSQRTLQILTLECQRLSQLIQTILDVSRLEAGRLITRMGPVALGPLLARVTTSTLASEPDRKWSLKVPEALPPAWADETLLEEVIRNVLENAMQYSPAATPIELVAGPEDGMLECRITDHGPGVPFDEQGRIFQSFHRIGDDETTVKGYGLGLYFADRLVRAQGGSISVLSPVWPDTAAPGSRFSLRIPVAADTPDDVGGPGTGRAEGGTAWPAS
jgi:signal transduction histidine kinase